MTSPLSAVIVDDEPLAREGLRLRLSRYPDIRVVAECPDAAAARSAIQSLHPDLLFLDVQLAEDDGFGVVDRTEGASLPSIIFVTAFAEHAVQAFRVGAIDYLLKPIDDAALDQAVSRARINVQQARARAAIQRLPVRNAGGMSFVETSRIIRIDSAGDLAVVRTHDDAYRIRTTMRAIMTQLDPAQFVRIHRTVIVAIREIAGLRPYGRNEHLVLLRDGTALPLSRRARRAVVAAISARS